jgi:Erv1 / Alr family
MSQRDIYESLPTYYNKNLIKESIKQNKPLDDKLHVITCIFNQTKSELSERCSKAFELRYSNIKSFIERMENEEENIVLYVAEIVPLDKDFIVTTSSNKRHFQLKSNNEFIHRFQLIYNCIKTILPDDWKALAIIDSDIEFDSVTWVNDTLKLLNGSFDVLQLYSNCIYTTIRMKENVPSIERSSLSFAYNNLHKFKYNKYINDFYGTFTNWCQGHAFAFTREFFEKIKNILKLPLDKFNMELILSCLNRESLEVLRQKLPNNLNLINAIVSNIGGYKLGYTPGSIIHHYHTNKNRNKNEMFSYITSISLTDSIDLKENNIKYRLEESSVKPFFERKLEWENKNIILSYSDDINNDNIDLYIESLSSSKMHPIWGVTTWTFLHTVAERWKNEDISLLMSTILLILTNTPCKQCSDDSKLYLENNLFTTDTIRTKNDLRMYLFEFHNSVNIKLNKTKFEFKDVMKMYSKIDFNAIYERFKKVFINLNGKTPEHENATTNIQLFFDENIHLLL